MKLLGVLIMLLLTVTVEAKVGEVILPKPDDSARAKQGVFEKVYTDKSNGLSWSKALPGFYYNGFYDDEGNFAVVGKCEVFSNGDCAIKTDTSDAAKACQNIGGKLPTKLEWESLIKNFDHAETTFRQEPTITLTAKGIENMQAIFGDMASLKFVIDDDIYLIPVNFWSSSAGPWNSDHAYVFSGKVGSIFFFDRRVGHHETVRCVR